MSYCAYKDCENKLVPLNSLTFFTLPKSTDNRRKIWIKNSGNKNLKNISDKTKKFFCMHHFAPKYIRKQFNRTTLTKDAIPKNYYENYLNEALLDMKENSVENDEEYSLDIYSTPAEAINCATTTSSSPIFEEIDLLNEHEGIGIISTPTEPQNHILSSNYSEDEHFVLSLVGMLGRFPERKKSQVKLKLLELLTQLETDLS